LDFGEHYGEMGRGFIEAHHLRPIATLEEGVPVRYDVAADFAVLCSNCHRMIHRFSHPSDLAAFRKAIKDKHKPRRAQLLQNNRGPCTRYYTEDATRKFSTLDQRVDNAAGLVGRALRIRL
jgi:hypothetical protein